MCVCIDNINLYALLELVRSILKLDVSSSNTE